MSFRKIKPTSVKRRDFETDKVKTVKRFPSFNIPLKHLPEAKNWSVEGDKKYYVTLELDMTEFSIREKKPQDGQDAMDQNFSNRAEFDITAIEVLPSKDTGSKTKKRFSRIKKDE